MEIGDSGFLKNEKNAPNCKKQREKKQKIHFGFSRNRIKVGSAEGVALNVLAAFFTLMIAGTNIFF